MTEASPNGIGQLDKEGPLRQKVMETAPVSTIQWGRLIACLPQLDSVDLIQPSLKLGRYDECDIVIHKSKFLPDQLLIISKEHFLISKNSEDDYITFITDLSKNGTYVNGQLIGRDKRIILQNNDLIAIGEKLPVYIFKSMSRSVPEDYLPPVLQKKYVPSCLLGVGACGEVRLAYDKFSCEKFAIKKIIKGRDTPSQIDNMNHPQRLQMEIDIMCSLEHPFIINMHRIVDTSDEVILVLEYAEGGELTKRITSENPMTESDVKFLFYQMVLAVQYLHSKGITHRDLKPANVLLTTKGSLPVIKVADFGLSKVSDGYDMMKTVCGTWHYIAPEVLDPEPEYSNQVDVWSLGVMLFYMLSRELPFKAMDKFTLGKFITSGAYNMRGPAWYEVSEGAKHLVRQMLYVNPRKRITIGGILKHPWIEQDHLMQYRVENLSPSLRYTRLVTTYSSSTKEERGISRGIKRIRLSDGCVEPCM